MLWGASAFAEAPSMNGPNGGVYVFNIFNESMKLVVEGETIGEIPGPSDGRAGKPTKYTPAGLRVNRSKDPKQGEFAIGFNDVRIDWNGFTAKAGITIPAEATSGVTLADDLLLFTSFSTAVLMTTDRGFFLGTFDVRLTLRTSAAAPLFAELQRDIGDSRVENPLKSRLLGILEGAEIDVALGQNVRARKILQEQVIPLLQRNSGQHRLSAKQAKDWSAETQKLVSKIPSH
jgi:hypothetical protein